MVSDSANALAAATTELWEKGQATLDERYFLLNLEGRIRVGELYHAAGQDGRALRLYLKTDFLMWRPETLTPPGGNRPVSVAESWLRKTNRRFQGVGMWENPPEGHLSLFEGLPPDAPGAWDTIRNFLLEVLCEKDETLLADLLNLLSYWIQHPCEVGLCGVMLTGGMGQGKGTFGEICRRLFGGNHFRHVTDPQHVAGRFNGHLAEALVLFADEALFRGDHRIMGTLKRMVTEPTLFVERKGIDGFPMPNRLKLVVASNDDLPIPLANGERRWLSLRAEYLEENKPAYFKRLWDSLDAEIPCFRRFLRKLRVNEELVRNPRCTSTLEGQLDEAKHLNPWVRIFEERRMAPVDRRSGRTAEKQHKLTDEDAWICIGLGGEAVGLRTAERTRQLWDALKKAGWQRMRIRTEEGLFYGWRAACSVLAGRTLEQLSAINPTKEELF